MESTTHAASFVVGSCLGAIWALGLWGVCLQSMLFCQKLVQDPSVAENSTPSEADLLRNSTVPCLDLLL